MINNPMPAPISKEEPISTVDHPIRCAFRDTTGQCTQNALSNSDFCWDHLDDKEGWKNNILSGNDLKKLWLVGVAFCGDNLIGVQLQEANLFLANLQGTDLRATFLQGANLTDSYLFDCDLYGATLSGDVIEGEGSARTTVFKMAEGLTKASFCGPRNCRLRERKPEQAEGGYRILKQYFTARGQGSDASWAAFKESKMQRKRTKGLAKFPMLLMEFLCGYGERPSMVIGWGLAVIIAFACFFGLFHMIHPTQPGSHEALGPLDCLYSSIVTFTTLGFGEITPRPEFRLWVSLEALLGAILMSLFVVTITRRYGARG